ncbi:MAG: CPBP family intramembrane metalloprotease [Lachnospiraceae bacterium]|nr:CPBP family intramembrane metalloprotease [Lachnospiraceae bacterium]
MNMRIIKSLYKKELLDVLRDKKTVIMMIVVPIVLYPLLIIVSLQVMTGISTSMSERIYKIALYDMDDNNIYYWDSEFKEYDMEEYSLTIAENISNPAEALANEDIDAYIKIEHKYDKEYFYIYYLSSVTNSNYAADRVSVFLKAYSEDVSRNTIENYNRITDVNIDADSILNPVAVTFMDNSTNEETAGSLMASVLPFLLVVSLLMGTMYPAIDTTAGERERGTLETLLTLPVSNTEIIVSKFLVVATIGVISSLLNIISLGGVGVYMYNMASSYMQNSGGVRLSKFIPVIFICILCILAFAVFISAVSMCVTAFAKSYKEANNYITPLSLVVMFASFISFIPNVKLTNNMALIPVTNICLLIRDLLTFDFNATAVFIVLISNVLYGIIAILFLGKIYNSEAVLFGESAGGVQIFERRKNIRSGGVPELGDVVLVLAITLVAMIYIGGAIQIKLGYYGVLGTQFIVLLIPLAAAVYTKKDLKKTFRLNKCSPRYVLGGIVMITGAIIIGVFLSSIIGAIFPESAADANELQSSLIGDNIWSMLLVVAVTPAFCEEMMFRGYVFTAFENKFRAVTAILISSALFGIYHMSIVRFVTTAFLGCVICYAAHKSKSIIPGMIMHFINNAISCISLYYPEFYAKVVVKATGRIRSFIDLIILFVFGLCFLIIGLMIINLNNSKKNMNKL